ncbi:hypothetical protein QR680_009558 [Steinernema hermaphroditum]|uniref:Uncharacterized protein n=1 Tax=Steinernema hermaphroditum TaxID=289476 RepID=A0AA39M9Y5_9BILA|nr:hypothetical protein QR680_009558 [Steinernema hermaphroditum]
MSPVTVLATFFVCWVVPVMALHCLVLSPGRGLVAHKCTSRNAVGCRIRVERDSITWYDFFRRHDKHLACVLKGEFDAGRRSGCVKKPSGTIRCWCYGQSNCNSPEKSRRLFEAFVSGNTERLDREVDDIDTDDPVDYAYADDDDARGNAISAVKPTERMQAMAEKKKDGAKGVQKKLATATKPPPAIEIKTQDIDDLNSVEYLPLPEAHALPTDPPNIFDTYSLMESAADYDMESETREPDGHYKMNVVKIRSKEAEPAPLEGNVASRCALIAVFLTVLLRTLF